MPRDCPDRRVIMFHTSGTLVQELAARQGVDYTPCALREEVGLLVTDPQRHVRPTMNPAVRDAEPGIAVPPQFLSAIPLPEMTLLADHRARPG